MCSSVALAASRGLRKVCPLANDVPNPAPRAVIIRRCHSVVLPTEGDTRGEASTGEGRRDKRARVVEALVIPVELREGRLTCASASLANSKVLLSATTN